MIMLVYYQDFPFPLSMLPERFNVENLCSVGEIIPEFEAFGKFSRLFVHLLPRGGFGFGGSGRVLFIIGQ
jgi:hypothetical protein